VLCRRAADGAARPEDGYRPPYDATAVKRLRAADAIIIGKCNMDEFAMGSSTEQSGFYPTRNPLDLERSPGGSSGGSAAAVAAKMTPAALGSDTGGSIRQPAAFTGTVGFKPTYGRVSRYGLIAFASSLDQVGAFAKDVASAALVTEVIAGHDPSDSTSIADPVGALVPRDPPSLAGVRVGVPRAVLESEGLDAVVARRFEETIEKARSAGATIVDVSLDHAKYAVATYYVVATAEASSNLARFDGVRYGDRAPGTTIDELYRSTRARGFGAEVKRRILLGTYVLSAGYYDAYYLRAQKARTLIARDFETAFERADVVVTPTTPTVAFRLGEKTRDPLSMYLADIFTLPASLAGLPAVSIPCGTTAPEPGAKELPVGLQIVGRPLADADVLRIAAGFENLAR
jgi:aspartyl-tRNA(Asn)/glutamyl-tRNA(Gln) amidotransferase subunit A